MEEEIIKQFLKEKRGYLKKSSKIVLERLGIYDQLTKKEKKKLEKTCNRIKREIIKEKATETSKREVDYNKLNTGKKVKNPKAYKGDPNNILVIGDLHEPFCLEDYLQFCKEIQIKENCGTVVFIGDIIDNHYSSYHETDPDGYSAGQELDRAIDKIAKWYEAFPQAYVIIGNHDRLVYRKAFSAGVSQRWIRRYDEVLNTPNWEFVEQITINGVCYNHGEGMKARNRMKFEMQSQVQGHYHSDFYLEYNVSPVARIFAMQVGCGVDRKSFAMAYGKHFKKPVIGCATVSGEIPIPRLHPMLMNE